MFCSFGTSSKMVMMMTMIVMMMMMKQPCLQIYPGLRSAERRDKKKRRHFQAAVVKTVVSLRFKTQVLILMS